MALRTIMAEVTRHMVRVCRPVEVARVTLVAVRVLQLVIAVDMACLTLHGGVRSRQREPRRIVIERRSLPVRR